MTNILEEGVEYVERVIGGEEKALAPEIADAEDAAKAAWASIGTSFNAAVPSLLGQGLALLEALLTGGEAAAALVIPADVAVDVATAKTALTTAVSAAKASLTAPVAVAAPAEPPPAV